MLKVLLTTFAALNLIPTKAAVTLDQLYNLLIHSSGYFTQWAMVKKLTDETPTSSELFGYDVAISGDQVVVGNGGSTGSAVIYEKENNKWVQKVRLSPAVSQNNDYYGRAVDIDNDTVIVGAYNRGPKNLMGAAFIYEKKYGLWEQAAVLYASNANPQANNAEDFGYSVGISGDYAVVGDRYKDPSGVTNAGAAYVFKRNGNGGWEEVQILTASNKGTSDHFGYSVDIDGDDIVVGARNEDSAKTDGGSVYVFRKNDQNQWIQIEREQANPSSVSYFGEAVSISGDMMAVGTHGQNYAFVFEKNSGNNFVQTAAVRPTGSGSAGYAVGISETGEVIVGNHRDSNFNGYVGAVSIYMKDINGIWNEHKIISPAKGSSYYFGHSVSISGDCAVIGAYGTDVDGKDHAGAAYIYCHAKTGTSDIEPNGDHIINKPNNWVYAIICILTVIILINIIMFHSLLCSRNNKNGYDVVKMVSDSEPEINNI